jgi:hypothetical protein
MAPLVALLLPAAGVLGPIAPETGLALLIVMMFLFGLLNGSTDIALFTVRQRRTDPAWMGRAFAVSMAFNFMGFPIGAAIAGAVVSVSMAAAIWFGVVACVVAAVVAAVLVPVREPEAGWLVAEATGGSSALDVGFAADPTGPGAETLTDPLDPDADPVADAPGPGAETVTDPAGPDADPVADPPGAVR